MQLQENFMKDDKNKTTIPEQNTSTDDTEEDNALNVQNPFNKNGNKVIKQDDVEGEKDFKEAQTERD